MAIKVDAVKVLNIDEVPYAVDAMSEEIQAKVTMFDGWNQKDADLSDELTMVRAAKNDLSRSIILAVRQEKEAAEQANTAEVEGTGDGTDTPAEASEDSPDV